MEYYPDQSQLMDDNGRFTPLFWEQHPDSPERVELRNWIDGAWAPAAEAAVHATMNEAYKVVSQGNTGTAEVAAASTEVAKKAPEPAAVAPGVGAVVVTRPDKQAPVIQLDEERLRRRPTGGGAKAFGSHIAAR